MGKRMAMWSSFGVVILVGALFVAASWESGFTKQPSQSLVVPVAKGKWGVPRVGMLAPNFKLQDMDGRMTSISDFRDKVVFLNFWATWCGPCRVEMPAMEQLYRDLKPKGLEILAVSTDPQGRAVTRPFHEALGLTFPILHDSDYRVGSSYGARTLPMTFLVDRQGVIRHRIFGARDWNGQEARQLIRTLLQESPALAQGSSL